MIPSWFKKLPLDKTQKPTDEQQEIPVVLRLEEIKAKAIMNRKNAEEEVNISKYLESLAKKLDDQALDLKKAAEEKSKVVNKLHAFEVKYGKIKDCSFVDCKDWIDAKRRQPCPVCKWFKYELPKDKIDEASILFKVVDESIWDSKDDTCIIKFTRKEWKIEIIDVALIPKVK